MDAAMNFNRRGQVTIFIILGLIIVVGIIIIFLLISPPELKILDENNPQAFIESCTREAVEDALTILSEHGGDIAPKGYINFKGKEVAYACYNYNYFQPCINQRPLLIEHIENEITQYIEPRVADCFFELENKLEDRYDIETTPLSLKTVLQSRNVAVYINKKLIMERGQESREFDDFKMIMAHPIYDLAEITMEIANQESRFCNFDELGYMILHPQYDITKFMTGEADIIYTVSEISTGEKLTFAVTSCELPPGY